MKSKNDFEENIENIENSVREIRSDINARLESVVLNELPNFG
jgi:hypothetical protein